MTLDSLGTIQRMKEIKQTPVDECKIIKYDRKLYEKGTNKTVFMQGLGGGGLKLICQFKASMMTPTVIIFNFAMITIMITMVMMMIK